MLNFEQYRQIKSVRDRSPFTENININEYIEGVRFRLSQWYGVDEDKITDEIVYKFLVTSDFIKKK